MEITLDHALTMRDRCISHSREKQWEYEKDPVEFRKERMTSAFDTLNYWFNKAVELKLKMVKLPPCSGHAFQN